MASQERIAVRQAVLMAAHSRLWTCDDGHKHYRPRTFNMTRLQAEVNRRNPRNSWSGSTIACAVFDCIEAGHLVYDENDHLLIRLPDRATVRGQGR